ncbi:MAG: helix-turn-helix transcriptional regulator [Clostridia bacterium]|nr:helix-turn-helix transcriptional regulator [Clostridia bacterium]
MTSCKAVALRICNIMLDKNLTKSSVYKKIAMNESTLRSILEERCKSVKLDTIILICDGLGISLQEFFDDDLFKRENLEID